MDSSLLGYALPLFIATALTLLVTLPAWPRRHERVMAVFIAMQTLTALWPLSVALEIVSSNVAWKIALVRIRPFTIASATLAFAMLSLEYSGALARRRRRVFLTLAGIGIAICLLCFLPPEYAFFRRNFRVAASVPHRILWDAGVLYNTYATYAYAMTLFALIVLLGPIRERNKAYRHSVAIISLSTLVPSFLDFLFQLNLTPWPEMNFSSLGMLAPAIAWAWCLSHYSVLDLVPLGRAVVFEHLQDMAFILDDEGRLADLNQAALAVLRPKRSHWRRQPAGQLPAPWAAILTGAAASPIEHCGRVYHVSRTPVPNPAGATTGVAILLHDVSEVARIHERLIESHRLEVVGRLAGGMAHEYNNLLTVILGYVAMLRETIDRGHPSRPMIDAMDRAGRRAATLTSQLLSFSRRQILQPAVLDINEVIRGMDDLIGQALGTSILFRFTAETGLHRVKIDKRQLEQSLVEMAMNARDAMPEGGVLTIATANHGDSVLLSVTDNGAGIAPANLSHLFEPFFTTKDEKQSAGLGLSMVHGFVTQSGGQIEVNSKPGHGAEFRIFLPRFAAGGD